MIRSIWLAGFLYATVAALAAPPPCPAGMPIGNVRLHVRRSAESAPLPLTKMNKLDEGDRILYSPALRPKEKRRGKVAVVLVAADPAPDQKHPFSILEPTDADQPAEWTTPFRPSLAVYVYGPDGISTRKLTGFLSKDDQLLAQLADYAEKTAQTESMLQAISAYEASGRSENMSAALEGFASRYGASGKIDRNAPLEEQTLALFRNLNPALAAYDPIAPPGAQRVGQAASLATTVAGMFLGSTVGLAAGSAAMGLNLKAILMPNTEFRSAFSPAAVGEAATLCGRREPAQGRSRIAYLWALRLPASGPPSLAIEEPRHIAAGMKSGIKVRTNEAGWRLAPRAHEWMLRGEAGEFRIPASVTPTAGEIELDLTNANVPPGRYTLAARWDWDDFAATGDLVVRPLSTFENVRPTSASRNRLRPGIGKQVITLEGDDFQFVRRVALARHGDRYAKPVEVPFHLPAGYRRGPQDTIEMQIDTSGLDRGRYSLLLTQTESKPAEVSVDVLPDPPKLEQLPVRVHLGENGQTVTLHGQNLERLSELKADGVEFELGAAPAGARSRTARVNIRDRLQAGARLDLRMEVEGYGEPLTASEAIHIAPPRPKIVEMRGAAVSGLDIAVKSGEMPAGLYSSVMLRVEPARQGATVHLGCSDGQRQETSVAPGTQKGSLRLQEVEPGSLFLSFDPGLWPNGCQVNATVEIPEHGRSNPRELGRVVTLPRIDGFELTSEAAGDGMFYGFLTGRRLELIDRTGWDGTSGVPVASLPAPLAGEADRQKLRITMPWPSPAPRAPVFIWLRGEQEGRRTGVRY